LLTGSSGRMADPLKEFAIERRIIFAHQLFENEQFFDANSLFLLNINYFKFGTNYVGYRITNYRHNAAKLFENCLAQYQEQ
jgi:hypothetical protein